MIAFDGAVTWEQLPGRTDPGAWHCVRVDWVANAMSLDLTVLREGGRQLIPNPGEDSPLRAVRSRSRQRRVSDEPSRRGVGERSAPPPTGFG